MVHPVDNKATGGGSRGGGTANTLIRGVLIEGLAGAVHTAIAG